MKVTVSKYLNVRVGKPDVNADSYQYLAPGSTIEVEDTLYEGGDFRGNTKWFRDKFNNYYWSGGVKRSTSSTAITEDIAYWFGQLQIETIWNTYFEQGDQSTVLILDTGINDHLPAFTQRLFSKPKNFVPGSITTKSIDDLHHGTHCAGLIASRQTTNKVGVAPFSKLLVAKINEYGGLKNSDTMKNALREYLKPKYENQIDVISICQALLVNDPELEQLIDKHQAKGRIIVAAMGNDNFMENLDIKQYPALYKNTISVGSCEKDNSLSKYTCFPSKADIFCYGTDIASYTNERFPLPLSGTSQATAIVSGICSLVISHLKKQGESITSGQLKTLMRDTGISITNQPNYKLIQPKGIFEQLILSV